MIKIRKFTLVTMGNNIFKKSLSCFVFSYTIAFLKEYYTFLVILTQSISFEWNFYIPNIVKKYLNIFFLIILCRSLRNLPTQSYSENHDILDNLDVISENLISIDSFWMRKSSVHVPNGTLSHKGSKSHL